MYSMKIGPAVTKIANPVRQNLLRKLRVPVLATTMLLGSGLINKAQAQEQHHDTYTPSVTTQNDTVTSSINNDTINFDTPIVNDSTYTDSTKTSGNLNENNLGFDTHGTAAEALYLKILANISANGENPYSAMYLTLSQLKGENSGSFDASSQLNDIIEYMKIYAKDYKEELDNLMKKNGSITEFKYGPNDSKTGTIFQSLNISGINQNDETDSITAVNELKDFMGNISYRVKAVTENAEVESNIHAGTNDVDIQLASLYRTKTDNGGNFSLSLNGRETIDDSTSRLSAGASVDYNKNDFSTGLYYYYNREAFETGLLTKSTDLEGFLKYKQNVKLLAGIKTEDLNKYYYSKLKLSGSRNLDNNLKLLGALSAEAGRINTNLADSGQINKTNVDLSALCGVSFKTDDIFASLNGRASYNYVFNPEGYNDQNLSLSLLGAFSHGKISVNAMVSMFKDIYNNALEAADASDNVNLATSVGFEVKDMFKGISPQFSYTSTSINNKVQHFFFVTLKTSLEALKKAQQ